ncbi:MAG: hypothetical protein GY953_57005, partial [bacterium]|nr:hypothetical protein [bacterium]
SITVKELETIADQPFSEASAPVVLEAPAKRIPGWGLRIKNTVDSLREGPVRSDEPLETIELIPMGAAHLRITCLPVIADRPDARYWNDIPNPDVFMLPRLTR